MNYSLFIIADFLEIGLNSGEKNRVRKIFGDITKTAAQKLLA